MKKRKKDSKKIVSIFGVKVGEQIFYIGKTEKEKNKENAFNVSDIRYQYHNPALREVFIKNDIDNESQVEIITLKEVPEDEWFDGKLKEVVEKYKDDHPLLNADWMKEGRRGYWDGTLGYWFGKTRDKNTLRRLSESKEKKIVEYDADGDIVKIWKSGKDIGENVFNDYTAVNGCGESRIYQLVNNKSIKGKFEEGSYWFRYQELIDKYLLIPSSIDIDELIKEEKENKSRRIIANTTTSTSYEIIQHNKNGDVINTFETVNRAAYHFKTNIKEIRQLCNGKRYNPYYLLKYGEKTVKPKGCDDDIPKYKHKPLRKPKPPKKVKVVTNNYIPRKTYQEIYQYDELGNFINTFFGVISATSKLGLNETAIRRICKGQNIKDVYDKKGNKIILKFGKKTRYYGK